MSPTQYGRYVMQNRTVLRVGAWAAILGGILGIVVNAFNPLRPKADELGDPFAPLHAAAISGSWEVVQIGVIVALLFFLAAFYTITRSIPDNPAQGWASFGLGAVFLGITLSVAGFAIYAGLPSAIEELGVDALVGVGVAVGGLLTGSQIVLFGVGGLLYGAAIVSSKTYPTWLGWAIGAGGVAGLVAGFMDAFIGPTVATNFVLFPVSSGLLILSVIYIGVLMLRKTPATP
jgi:hypothetical protein